MRCARQQIVKLDMYVNLVVVTLGLQELFGLVDIGLEGGEIIGRGPLGDHPDHRLIRPTGVPR